MTKVVHCRDVGFDCDGVVRADTEQAALGMVVEHARTAHGMDTLSAELLKKVKAVIREE
jgi:predicted small metal-binding protein